ncbi:hypothetical protein JF66_05230 [Cryobacterium sp. MLB-32]|uniref:2'-5' RNA ligase family protein n=1 Tax=Cryobacterium sp. MLB-32 TaxID=1529318 RepID=UPI0004E6E0A9|nr:2'-5' RNA ligase family protein [Cryobacterium sp. MLB-32]KFF60343.1 hypothetical protein JF66_05230 [Cryobacterium sp. MLB-32]
MPRLVVVLPLTPLHEGDSFLVQDWPLHVTVLPPFLTDAEPGVIASAIAEAASSHRTLTAVAGQQEMFGRRTDVPVTVVVPTDELSRLHEDLIDAVRPFGAAPDEPAFTGNEFRPHITIKSHGRIDEGTALTLQQIALVDMAPRASSSGRSVLATFTLPRH